MVISPAGKTGPTQISMFSSVEHPVRGSRLQDDEREWMTRALNSPPAFSTWLAAMAPVGSLGRMCPVPVPLGQAEQRVAMTWDEESESWTRRTISTNFAPGWSNSAMVSPSQALTFNTSVFRSGASACSLLDILETGDLPRRYYSTPRACAGYLRRAEKQGKLEGLPGLLVNALRAVVDRGE